MKNKKRVLVLGGNGFIGTNLCVSLIKKGYDVTSFDRVMPPFKIKKLKYEEGDFFDNDTLQKIVKDKDVIIHAISTINPGNSNTDYMRGYQKDFIQTVRLCELARDNGIKIIFLSSGGTVYGNQKKQPIKEEYLPHPINHYGNIKLCIENTLLTFAYQNDMDVAIARISNPYGPGQDYQKGVGFIDAVIRNALSGNAIDIFGDGSVVRDYIYIDDVCELLTGLIEKNIVGLPIVNISSGVGASNNDIIDIVRKIHGPIKVNYKGARPVDLHKVILDNSIIKKMVDYELYSLEAGIEKYYAHLKESYWS